MMIEDCDSRIFIIVAIVDKGKGSKVLKLCRQSGISGGTICYGNGTVGQSMFTWLDNAGVRKEIVIMAAPEKKVESSLDYLNHKLKLSKPGHGILFTIALEEIYGSKNCSMSAEDDLNYISDIEERGVKAVDNLYKAIFTIVDRGNSELVIESAEQAGAKGATIINARGAGSHETSTLFSMLVEPEKEIILIIAEEIRVDAITTAIRSAAELDKPGKGILFVAAVDKTMGLY